MAKALQPPGTQIYGTYPRLQQGSPECEEGKASRAVALSATLALEILALLPRKISITLKNDPNNSSSMIEKVWRRFRGDSVCWCHGGRNVLTYLGCPRSPLLPAQLEGLWAPATLEVTEKAQLPLTYFLQLLYLATDDPLWRGQTQKQLTVSHWCALEITSSGTAGVNCYTQLLGFVHFCSLETFICRV